jgi:lysophospholipase L1-like esterase
MIPIHSKRGLKRFYRQLLILGLAILAAFMFWMMNGSGQFALAPAVAENHFPVTPPQTNPEKVVFFGSSTTVGVGSTRGDRRYSTLLSRYLGWQEFNESLSGSSLSDAPRTDKSWPIPSALRRWKDAVLRRHPDRVLMLYGANDAYWKLPLGNPESPQPATFRGDAKQLFSEMQSNFQPKQLIVVTPQPNQATLPLRGAYDSVLKEEALKIGAPFIDSAEDPYFLKNLADLSADGLHLNNLGHAAFASYLAGKLTDLGIASPPKAAVGGNQLSLTQTSLPGGALRIDTAHPLSFGTISEIKARWVAQGQARLIIFRPNGLGGFDAVYRTELFSVQPGESSVSVPRWWVLEGDRLAVWTNTDCLGAETSVTPDHFAVSRTQDSAPQDVMATEVTPETARLTLWVQ